MQWRTSRAVCTNFRTPMHTVFVGPHVNICRVLWPVSTSAWIWCYLAYGQTLDRLQENAHFRHTINEVLRSRVHSVVDETDRASIDNGSFHTRFPRQLQR
uniref:Uncharacterized protein n=1 Tax=Schistocephalus solidus TaxID=70667 RepID=A0A0X3PXU8_SCHSO